MAFPWLEKDVSLAVAIKCAALAYAQAGRGSVYTGERAGQV